MFPLTKHLRLDRFANLNNRHRQVIVSDTTDTFIIGQGYEAHIHPAIFQTNDCDMFLGYHLPKHINAWIEQDAVIYCDDAYFIRIMTYWLRHLFTDLTQPQLREIYFILCLERSFRDEDFRWLDEKDNTEILKQALRKGPPLDPRLHKAIIRHWDIMPSTMNDLAYLNDAGFPVVAELRHRLKQSIVDIVRNTDQRLRFLYYTPQLEAMLCATPDENDPRQLLDLLGELRLSVRGEELYQQLGDPERFDVLRDEYYADQARLHDNPYCCADQNKGLNELMVPFTLLALSDASLPEAYYDQLGQVDRLTMLLPREEMSVYNINLLTWALRTQRRGGTLPQVFAPAYTHPDHEVSQ